MSDTADSCITKSAKKNPKVEKIRSGLIYYFLVGVAEGVGSGSVVTPGESSGIGAGVT